MMVEAGSGQGDGAAAEEAPIGPLDDRVELEKPESPSPLCWRQHRCLLIATLGSLIVAIVLVATMGVLVPRIRESGAVEAGAIGIVPGETGNVAPTTSPTSSPTVPPQWKVDYISLTADFSLDSEHQLEVNYEIGIHRAYQTQILAADCETPLSGIDLDLTAERTPKDQYRDSLTLKYNVDKSQLRGSNVWDDFNDQLTLQCHEIFELHVLSLLPSSQPPSPNRPPRRSTTSPSRPPFGSRVMDTSSGSAFSPLSHDKSTKLAFLVQLVLPADVSSSGEMLVIVEDKRVLEIDFDMSVSFGIGLEVELAGEGQGKGKGQGSNEVADKAAVDSGAGRSL